MAQIVDMPAFLAVPLVRHYGNLGLSRFIKAKVNGCAVLDKTLKTDFYANKGERPSVYYATSKYLCFCFLLRLRPATWAGVMPFKAECGRTKLKKKMNMEMRLFADWNEEKPCLVLYHALNCLLKHSIRLLEMSSLKL